jgi:hypothetical protein
MGYEIVKDHPNYYAVLPATVRYDNNLSPLQKIIYAEISALSSSTGKCWCTNNYLAKLYGVTTTQISRVVNALIKYGHIRSETETTDLGTRRILSLVIDKNVKASVDINVKHPHDKNVIHNNIKNNNTSKNIYIRDHDDFDRFWSLLKGRKIAKPSALKAYVQIDTELSAEDLAKKYNRLLDTREEKFCPYPQKWLKNEGWNDTVVEKSTFSAYVSDDEVYRDEDGYIISKKEYEELYK